MTTGKTIYVGGARDLVGSHITRAAMARGYGVHSTLRDRDAAEKAQYLQALPGAERLRLFGADMADAGAFYCVSCG